MPGDNRPVSTTPPESGSSTTAPSSACSAPARPRPAGVGRRAPSPDSQNRCRSKAYVGSSTKPAAAQHAAPIDADTRNVTPAPADSQEPLEPAVVAAQGGDDDGLGVAVERSR